MIAFGISTIRRIFSMVVSLANMILFANLLEPLYHYINNDMALEDREPAAYLLVFQIFGLIY